MVVTHKPIVSVKMHTLKAIVHRKIKMLQLFPQPHTVPNLYDFFLFLQNTKDILNRVSVVLAHTMKGSGIQKNTATWQLLSFYSQNNTEIFLKVSSFVFFRRKKVIQVAE